MYVVCHQETKVVLSKLIKSMKKCLKDVNGLDVEVFVEHRHWDGKKVKTEEVFTEEFEHAIGHVCLQHGRLHTKRRCSGGFKMACPNILDMIAFLPPFAFHLSAELLLEKLEAAGQISAFKSLKVDIRTKSQFAMFLVDGLIRAKWNSSFLDLEPLYTSYVSNAKEADWRVDHIAQGARKKQMLESLIHNCTRQWTTWEHEKKFDNVDDEACGSFLHPLRLLKGNGLWEKKTSLHNRSFVDLQWPV